MSKPSQFTIIGPNASEIARRTFKNVDMAAQLNEMADEIERLRAALREITIPAYEYLSDEGAAKHKIKIARTALGEKE